MKIIPAIDLMEGKVVRLYKGDPNQKTVYSDDPVDVARRWDSAGADILHLVDLDATLGRGSNLDIIKKILDAVSVDVEVAGGLRDKSTVMEMAKLSGPHNGNHYHRRRRHHLYVLLSYRLSVCSCRHSRTPGAPELIPKTFIP